MTSDRPPLASGALDRDAATRMHPERLRAAWDEPGARLLLLRGVEIPVRRSGGVLRLALRPVAGSYALTDPETGGAGHVYLGRTAEGPVFGAPDRGDIEGGDLDGEEWRHPFEVGGSLGDTERELVAVASALLRWHENAGFSSRDGSATAPEYGGWARRDAHGGELFPRTDPAVIVLIEHEDRVLLGSNALWDTGRFSLLAGFVEAGESLEQTVAREVFEESGVRVGEIEYVTSQPWPFPRSLMLGFRARLAPGTDPDDLHPDPEEISELRWFSRRELREPMPGITLPMPMSIARWMIDRWVAEGDAGGE
ncbi:MAG: NAD(+) diphosphatase [Leucobacter sp.]